VGGPEGPRLTPDGDPRPVDAVVVGAGASGAAAAWRLAEGGLSVVCLERGGWVDPALSPSRDPDWELALQTRFHPDPDVRRAPADYPVDTSASPIRPALFNGVGGSTIRWGAHVPRLKPSDLRTRTLDGVGRDWPLAYGDLVPYWDLNDRITGVSGLAGDPANPPRSARSAPPLPLCPLTEALARAFDRLGWHWWPSDSAILSEPRDGREACNGCGPCGLGCPRRARASADVVYWPHALAAGAELRTGCRVVRVEAGLGGRGSEVSYLDASGTPRRQSCGLVVMAANGIGTPRLLLHSASSAHPRGLANGSGMVGRTLMHHPTAIITGVFDGPASPPAGAFACALFSQQFYETDRARGFVRGYQLQALRGVGPLTTARGGYMARVPWGDAHHREFLRRFGRSVSLTVTTEDLPDPDNRVTLHPALADAAGVPAPRLAYRLDRNVRAMLDHGIARAEEALRAAGAVDVVVNPLARQAGFHLLGTAAMGDDPATSVTDAWGRAHEAEDLWVVDGSLFPTAGAVNPTPTIQALALRAADRILGRAPLPPPTAAAAAGTDAGPVHAHA